MTRKAFTDLAIWMVVLGLLVGAVFPFFAVLLDVDPAQVLSVRFFIATLGAGLVLGLVNYGLAHVVFRPRLQIMSQRMNKVEDLFSTHMFSDGPIECDPVTCHVAEDSEDEIGECARSFNHLIRTLTSAHDVETAVNTFSRTLSEHLNFDELTTEAVQLLLEYTGSTAATILLEQEGQMQVAGNHGIRTPAKLAESDHVRHVLRTGMTVTLDLPNDLQVDGALTNFRPRQVLLAPIEYNKAVFGILVLAAPQSYETGTRRLLDLLLQSLGLALQNSLVHARLQHMAAIDPLTGLYNRRFGSKRLREEFVRASRNNNKISVLMFDLDHFKKVNDTYGHLIGDRVLIAVSKVAQKLFREGDILVRYGGEEFFAILPGAATNDIRELGERLRRSIEETEVRDGDLVIRITGSVGGAVYPDSKAYDNEEELLKAADEALYSAKQNGRNQVVLQK
ncbi:GGDEF domain-containing protein [Magnetospira thiophila]